MRRYLLRLIVALLSFTIGITSSAVWSSYGLRPLGESIKPQPDAPLRISSIVLDASDNQAGTISFDVDNVSTKQVHSYTIRYVVAGETGRDGTVSRTIYALMPGQALLDGFSYSFTSPSVKEFTLLVDSVQFADGSTWQRTTLPNARD